MIGDNRKSLDIRHDYNNRVIVLFYAMNENIILSLNIITLYNMHETFVIEHDIVSDII